MTVNRFDVVESTVAHSAGAIRWIDGAANPKRPNPPAVTEPLSIVVDAPEAGLRTLHKAGMTLLWRRQPDGMLGVQANRPSDEDLERPADVTFDITGRVQDPSGRFNPRMFRVQGGTTTVQQVVMHRSLKQTRIPAGGALRGHVAFSEDEPASWAVLELSLRPIGSDPAGALEFRCQANRAGDFWMPLTWSPSHSSEIDVTTNPPTLRVSAHRDLIGQGFPDLNELQAAEMDVAGATWQTSRVVEVSPREVVDVQTPGEHFLRIRVV